jgi:thiol-disulfide isomerase/thioredoxin
MRLLVAFSCTLLGLVAAGGDEPQTEQALLGELRALAQPPGPVGLKGKSPEEIQGLARRRAERALELVKEFETRHSRSPALSEARAEALKVLSTVHDDALAGRGTRLAEELKQSAPRGSELAAQAQLYLLGLRVHLALKDARSSEEFRASWRRQAEEIRRQCTAYLADYPRYRAGADSLSGLVELAEAAGDVETARALRSEIARHFADHPAARVVARDLKIGKEFDCRFTPVGAARPISLRDLHGKVVVLFVWASWCVPCRTELGPLKALHDKYQRDGLEILGVSLDENEERAQRFIQDNKIGWKNMVGPAARQLGEEWGVELLPVFLIVDRKGRLRSSDALGKLDRLIPELLAERD